MKNEQGKTTVSSPTSTALLCDAPDITDEDIRRFAKVIFERAFNLGCFFEETTKRDKAYNLFIRDIKQNTATERVKAMIERIDT